MDHLYGMGEEDHVYRSRREVEDLFCRSHVQEVVPSDHNHNLMVALFCHNHIQEVVLVYHNHSQEVVLKVVLYNRYKAAPFSHTRAMATCNMDLRMGLSCCLVHIEAILNDRLWHSLPWNLIDLLDSRPSSLGP